MAENTIGNVERDEKMDLNSLLSSTTTSAEPEAGKESIQEEKPKVEHKSPLDLAIEKQKETQKGIIVDSANEEVGPVQLRPNTDTDAFREGFADELSEQEDLAKKAQLIYAVKQPENQGEYAEMITEIAGVTVDESNIIHVPDGAKYIVPKNPEIVARVEAQKAAMQTEEQSSANSDVRDSATSSEVDATVAARKEKKD